MSRLFTFGCSYTRYLWPTWATLLGFSFDEYQNWGKPGGGNMFILHSLLECDIKNQINKDDVVIIMWSSYNRQDMYRDNRWITPGNIFITKIYDQKYVDNYWSLKGAILQSLNAVHAVKKILNPIGLKWYNASMVDMKPTLVENKMVDNFIAVIGLENLFMSYPELKIYQEVTKGENWIIPSLREYAEKNFKEDEFDVNDKHPTPRMHLEWLKTVLCPVLGMEISEKAEDLVNHWENKYKTDLNESKQFMKEIEPLVDRL